MKASRREIVELWQRAQEALRATNILLVAGFPDFAAARAYYVLFSMPRLPCCCRRGKRFEVTVEW
jgi:uncharacterized protein (UPF0332 family)